MRKKKYSKDFIKILCDKRIEDPTLPTSTMNQKISNKKSFTLPAEIKRRKRAINKEFDKRFGKYFIPYIPEAVEGFERQMKDFFFSPKSKFLNKFPKLKKCIYSQKKLDMEKLKKRINIGSLLYLNLREHLVSNKATLNDKIFSLSKNYSLTQEKDELSETIYKAKRKTANRFLDYKKLTGFIKNQYKSQGSINSNSNKGNNMEINKTVNNNNNKKGSSFLSIFKNLLNKDQNKNMILKRNDTVQKNLSANLKKTKKQSLKNFTYIPDYPNDEINYNPFNSNNSIYKKTYSSTPFFLYKNNALDKNSQKENTETLTNSNTSISNNNNYYPFQSNIKNNIRYMTLDNKNETIENISNDSNDSIIEIIPDDKSVISNIRSKSIKTMNTTGNKEFKKKIFPNKMILNTSNFNSTKNMFDVNKMIGMQTSKKYVKRISSKVQDLNSVTSKCNDDLIKLIYINHDLKIKQNNKIDNRKNFDINELLSDKKQVKQLISYQKRKNNKENLEKFVQKAAVEALDLGKKNKKFEKKNFVKNINHLPDELALYMVGNLFKTNKVRFNLEEVKNKRKVEKEIKNRNIVQKTRKKAKYNYVKIIRLRNDLSVEKDTFYNIYHDMENKKLMFNTGKDKCDFLEYKRNLKKRKRSSS